MPGHLRSVQELSSRHVNGWRARCPEGIEDHLVEGRTDAWNLDEVRDKYRTQMTRMVTTVAPKRTTKYAFDGPNPARDPEDIRKLLEFSIENEFKVEMLYAKADGSETTERVVPQSNEQGRIYALNRSGNTYRAYRLERVLRARLI